MSAELADEAGELGTAAQPLLGSADANDATLGAGSRGGTDRVVEIAEDENADDGGTDQLLEVAEDAEPDGAALEGAAVEGAELEGTMSSLPSPFLSDGGGRGGSGGGGGAAGSGGGGLAGAGGGRATKTKRLK